MATVHLAGEAGEVIDPLPDVCAACGAPAATDKDVRFWWHPPWVNGLLASAILMPILLVPAAIIAVVLTQKRMRVRLPLCARHRRPWLLQRLCLAVSVVAGLACLVAIPVVMIRFGGRDARSADIFLIVFLGAAIIFAGLLIALAYWGRALIRADKITDESVTLVNVSEEFRDGLAGDARKEDPERS